MADRPQLNLLRFPFSYMKAFVSFTHFEKLSFCYGPFVLHCRSKAAATYGTMSSSRISRKEVQPLNILEAPVILQ